MTNEPLERFAYARLPSCGVAPRGVVVHFMGLGSQWQAKEGEEPHGLEHEGAAAAAAAGAIYVVPYLDPWNWMNAVEGKYFSINDLDFFFAKIGVYLKSQEVTELLNHCKHSKTQIDLIRMVNLLKTDVPCDILQTLNRIFDKLSGSQPAMDVEELLQHLNENEYPQSELMNKNLQVVKESILNGFKHILGDNKIIKKEQFIEFHNNILWVLPDYKVNDFKNKLPLMWGIRRLRQ